MSKAESPVLNDASVEFVRLEHTFVDKFKGPDEVSLGFRFRRPTPQQAERAQKTLMKKTGLAMRTLCLECCHAEDKERLAASLEEYPGLATTFGGALLSCIGYGDLGN